MLIEIKPVNGGTIQVNTNAIVMLRVALYKEDKFGVILTTLPGKDQFIQLDEVDFYETRVEAELALANFVETANVAIGQSGGGNLDLGEWD